MLETVDLTLELKKKDYKAIAPGLREKLRQLQYKCKDEEIPIVIVFEGWDAAGKGLMISRLLERLDPRGFTVHPSHPPTEEESAHPFLWRYWVRLPEDGQISLFDRSWYGRVLIERVAEMVPESVWQRGFEEILQFERQLADDGTVIVKFFLHITKKEQRRRFLKLENDKYERWRVTKWDWKHHREYDKYVEAIEEMVARTDTPFAPWTIVEATDRYFCEVKIFETLVRAMEEAIEWRYHHAGEIGRSKVGKALRTERLELLERQLQAESAREKEAAHAGQS